MQEFSAGAWKIARIEGELLAMAARMKASKSGIDSGLAKLREETARRDA